MPATDTADSGRRARPHKVEAVAELTEKLSRATSAVVTDYRGMTVKQLEGLRASLRAAGVEYVVVKNTLARRAAAAAGLEEFAPALVGPVGLALGYDELSTPARLLSEHHRLHRQLPMVAGMAERRLLGADEVGELASLPTRAELYSQLAGTLQAPVASLAGSLESIAGTLASALDTYRGRLEAA